MFNYLLKIFCCSLLIFFNDAYIQKFHRPHLKSFSRFSTQVSTSESALEPLFRRELVRTPDQVWDRVYSKGKKLSYGTKRALIHRGLLSGYFLAIGGVLTASVGFDTPGFNPFSPGNGGHRLLTGAIGFPSAFYALKIFGADPVTSDMFCSMTACLKGSISLRRVFRLILCTFIGSLVGAFSIAVVMKYSGIPALKSVLYIATNKLIKTPMQVFIRGILGGWLICLSTFLADASTTMAGKMLGVWLPISTSVMCDFDIFLGSFFFLVSGLMNGAPVTLYDIIRLVIPSFLGNCVGAVIMACAGAARVGTAEPLFTANAKSSRALLDTNIV